MPKTLLRNILTSLVILLCLSCADEMIFSDSQSLDENWHMDDKKRFEFTSQDTTSTLDFYLDIRNSDIYPYRNLYCFIDMVFPNKRVLHDTLEIYLASPSGKWLGSGAGSTFDNSFLYKYKKKLPLEGDYSITVQHAMRDTLLKGIEEIGIHIDYASE